MQPRTWPLLLLSPLALLLSPPRAHSAPRPSTGPAPAWVRPLPVPAALEEPEGVHGGVYFLLLDRQTRAGLGAPEQYTHIAEKLTTPAGVESGSQVRIAFDPEYEQVALHFVRVIRGGRTRDVLDSTEVQVLRQEAELERQLFNGRLTALLILKDLRAGDVVEYAWTRRGANPTFEGHIAYSFTLASQSRIERISQRLLVPKERAVRLSHLQTDQRPSEQIAGAWRELLWDQEHVAPVLREEEAPTWSTPEPQVEITDFSGWGELAAWGSSLFKDRSASRAMSAQVEEWRKLPSDEERFLAALRFVQDQVRYFGIEIGAGSHRPNPPAEVFDRRFGDCKDKSLLLATLLGMMGIQAHPALVHTAARQTLDRHLPSPLAFDHVVVKVLVGDRARWVDATRSLERGPLESLSPPPFRRALVLASRADALEDIPEPQSPEPTVEEEEHYDAAQSPARLTVTTRYRGRDADQFRADLAATPVEELSRNCLNHYARDNPGIEVARPMEVEDDPVRNRVVMREHYLLKEFWKDGERELYASDLAGALRGPATRLRQRPLAVAHPVHREVTLRVSLPREAAARDSMRKVESSAFLLTREERVQAREASIRLRYRSLSDSVPAEAMAEHLAALKEGRELLSFVAQAPASRRGASGQGVLVPALSAGLVLLLLVGLALAPADLGAWWAGRRARARRRRRALELRDRAGESAATAVEVRDLAGAFEYAGRLRCRCGRPWTPRERPREEDIVILDGKAVLALALGCEPCARQRRLFVRLEDLRLEQVVARK